MIKFENTEVMGWGHAIRGMRNPMNSWEKGDSYDSVNCGECGIVDRDGICKPAEHRAECEKHREWYVGPNDLDLMKRLRNAGTDHRKFMRMVTVYVDITAPLYWWKEFDTYKVGTVANSCSTMHKIAEKEFTLEDFSTEHLFGYSKKRFHGIIDDLNYYRNLYFNGGLLDFKKEVYGDPERVEPKDKRVWWQMIQLLPSSYNQKRTVMMNYEVLANIYKSRKNHKLDEWAEHKAEMIDVTTSEDLVNGDHRPHLVEGVKEYFGFCDWIKTLPYSELITGISLSDIPIANEIMEEAERRVR